MSEFTEALQRLGITPQRGRTSPVSYSRPVTRPLAVRNGTSVASSAASRGVAPKFPNAVPLVGATSGTGTTSSQEGDDGGWWNSFKQGAGAVLDAIDTGRAFTVSGVKELSDALYGSRFGEAISNLPLIGETDEERRENLARMGSASWDDFVSQGRRNIGFREVWDAAADTEGDDAWLNRIIGFAGDVALDPTAWVTLGTSTAARAPVSGATRQAVTDGGGRQLAKHLADVATEKGLREAPGVERLVADAYLRGRGAITPRGLARAGVDDATRDALGIPSLARTVGRDGVRLPGSATVANVIEDAKGVAKSKLKTTPLAYSARALAPNPLGQRELIRTLASRAASQGEKFDAALALNSINAAQGTGRRWATLAITQLEKGESGLGPRLKKLDGPSGQALTRNIESGVDEPLANDLRNWFQATHDELRSNGVELGNLGVNYVPHVVTDDLRALARKEPNAAKLLVGLETEVGAQRVRRFGVNPGQDNVFLGETLRTGTIEELNGISMKKLGVNAFVDDVREVLPRYVAQMGDALSRSQQVRLLTDKGVIRSRAEKLVTKPMTAEEAAVIQDAKATLKAARDEQRVALKDGSTYRRAELREARTAAYARKRELAAQVRDVERRMKDAQRGVMGARMKLARQQQTVTSLRDSLQMWRGIATEQRGITRRKALAEIDKLEARIVEVNRSVRTNEETITRIMSDPFGGGRAELGAATEGFAAFKQERERLLAESASLSERAEELRALEIGQGTMPAERYVRQASERLQEAQAQAKDLGDQVSIASSALDGAVADVQLVQDQVRDASIYLDKIIDKATGAKLADAEDLRDRLNAISKLIAGDVQMQPMQRMMVQFEAMAAAADVRALGAASSQASMRELIDAMSNPAFNKAALPYVENGMVAIGENMQIPGWLNQALKVEPVRMNALEANTFIRKFYNLWKGYAILRPGFHVRNAYSAMFNMYLEAGSASLANVRRAHAFDALVQSNPENFLELATKRWGQQEATMLNDAHMAMSATGAGQAAGEFTSSELRTGTWNPASENFRLLKGNRKIGELVERKIRTAHAYDVLKRGGNIDQAIDVVNKWHFNYTDVSALDRQVRMIAMPFWMFYSRNIALQGQTWVRNATRLNRVYMNAERNLAAGEEADTDVPEWFDDMAGIRLPGGGGTTPTRYLFPDLPAAQFPAQLDKFTDPLSGQLLGDVGPIKLPLEIMAGRQFFSGVPLEREGTEAGLAGSLLGMAGLPGTGTAPDGTRMIDERTQYAINSLIPGAGQIDRYLGMGGPANAERQNYSLLSALTGIGIRENNDRTRQGERYRQMLEEQQRQQYLRSIGG